MLGCSSARSASDLRPSAVGATPLQTMLALPAPLWCIVGLV